MPGLPLFHSIGKREARLKGLTLPPLSRLSSLRHGAAFTSPRPRRKITTEPDPPPSPQSAVPKDVAIQRFLAMATSFGVTPPQMGRMTTRIMRKGTDVLPCHMITALQALCVLSKDENWRVG